MFLASRRGFEPPIYRLGGGCVIHYATGTFIKYFVLLSARLWSKGERSFVTLDGTCFIHLTKGGGSPVYVTIPADVCQPDGRRSFLASARQSFHPRVGPEQSRLPFTANGSKEIDKKTTALLDGCFKCRHRPIFPGRLQPSIFGTSELNFRVRDGNGWTLTVINTDYSIYFIPPTMAASLTERNIYYHIDFQKASPFFIFFKKSVT